MGKPHVRCQRLSAGGKEHFVWVLYVNSTAEARPIGMRPTVKALARVDKVYQAYMNDLAFMSHHNGH